MRVRIIKSKLMFKSLKQIITKAIILGITFPLFGQNIENESITGGEKIKLDPSVRYGRLDNGLTYYIQQNKTKKGSADFYLVQNVGSMQEDDHQRGYTHFMERIALQSSKHFPEADGIKKAAERMGLKVNENLKLETSFDESIYSLQNVALRKPVFIDTCLLILLDWAAFLSFDNTLIEKEQSAIREEWIKKRNTKIRLLEKQLPVMYPNSKYSSRLPTGILAIIENLYVHDFLSFYKNKYRPDLQAVVIVGDIDPIKTEEKLKRLFAQIPTPEITAIKEYFVVQNNDTPLLSITKDEQIDEIQLTLYYKLNPLAIQLKGTVVDFITIFTQKVIKEVMNERFKMILKKPNPPISSAEAKVDIFYISKTKDAWVTSSTIKQDKVAEGLKIIVEETDRLRKSGITDEEYKNALKRIFKDYDLAISNRNLQKPNDLAKKYINHFLDNALAMNIEYEYELIKNFASIFDKEAVNRYINDIFSDYNHLTNIVISLICPGKADHYCPTESQLADMYVNILFELEKENSKNEQKDTFIPHLPEPGKIIKHHEDDLFGSTVYHLNNGVKVIFKKTELEKDKIIISGISPGGTTLYKEEKDILNLRLINAVIKYNGLSEFNHTTLEKLLRGKRIEYVSGLTPSSEIIDGKSSKEHIKTLFELIYLHFEKFRPDDAYFSKFKEQFINQQNSENGTLENLFRDSLFKTIYNNDLRAKPLKAEDIEKVNYDRIIEIANERFADASDFIFTIVGNTSKDIIEPLIEQYLATLPALNRVEIPDESQEAPFQKGIQKNHATQTIDSTLTKIMLMYTGEMPYNLKNLIIALHLNNIIELTLLSNQLLKYEKEINNLQSSVDLYDFPKGRTSIQIFAETTPRIHQEVVNIIKEELHKIAIEGTPSFIFKRSFESIFKKRVELMATNDYWNNIIGTYYSRGFDAHTDYNKILNEVNINDIKTFLKTLLNQGNLIEVLMYPEK